VRTKAALAQKKAQGAVLGNRTNLSDALAANREAADAFAANVLPIVRQIPDGRVTTFRAIAAALNDRGVRTARGGASAFLDPSASRVMSVGWGPLARAGSGAPVGRTLRRKSCVVRFATPMPA
jgi:hypothetical protein